jgi:hypothetical protein
MMTARKKVDFIAEILEVLERDSLPIEYHGASDIEALPIEEVKKRLDSLGQDYSLPSELQRKLGQDPPSPGGSIEAKSCSAGTNIRWLRPIRPASIRPFAMAAGIAAAVFIAGDINMNWSRSGESNVASSPQMLMASASLKLTDEDALVVASRLSVAAIALDSKVAQTTAELDSKVAPPLAAIAPDSKVAQTTAELDSKFGAEMAEQALRDGDQGQQAALGHMLFVHTSSRAEGLMLLQIAKNGAKSPEDDWIGDLCRQDIAAASAEDRKAATAMLDARRLGDRTSAQIAAAIQHEATSRRSAALAALYGRPVGHAAITADHW